MRLASSSILVFILFACHKAVSFNITRTSCERSAAVSKEAAILARVLILTVLSCASIILVRILFSHPHPCVYPYSLSLFLILIPYPYSLSLFLILIPYPYSYRRRLVLHFPLILPYNLVHSAYPYSYRIFYCHVLVPIPAVPLCLSTFLVLILIPYPYSCFWTCSLSLFLL